jgi:tRNA threonylcarbamoyladenosine modification (KEOPS) complex  Pcc1 subunit
MAECVISVKSNTVAERVRRLAAAERIPSEIVSVDPKLTKRGCSVGLRLPCEDVAALKRILEKRKITYGDIFGGGV